jgi:general secretion pathway protein G
MVRPGYGTGRKPGRRSAVQQNVRGFSLVEVMIVIAIMVTVLAIAIPNYMTMTEKARILVSMGDVKQISTEIGLYVLSHGTFPAELNDVGFGDKRDPWGRLYEYAVITGEKKGGAIQKGQESPPAELRL